MNIYRVTLEDLTDPTEGLLAISLVDFPAVQSNFLKFRDEKPQRIMLKADTDQHIITGVALLADTPIYRHNPMMGGDYYIVFEADTIRKLVEKYSRDGLLNMINLQHDSTTYAMDKCVMVESYFVDHARGIVPEEFKNIPDGSWIVSFKVEDPELWEAIKASNGEEGGLNGFSVEVCTTLRPKELPKEPTLDDFVASLVQVPTQAKTDPLREYFDVTKKDVREAMDARKLLEVRIAHGSREENTVIQIKEMGVKGADTIVTAFEPGSNEWRVIKVKDIMDIVITDEPMVPWKYDTPSYKAIEEDDDITITESVIAARNEVEECILGQYFAMITYDDESTEHQPATGMRQVQICAYGTTLKGNECFRAYELFGDTSQNLPGGRGNWRLFLTRRCTSFHIMKEAKQWGTVPPGYRMGDVDMTTIYAEVDPSGIKRD